MLTLYTAVGTLKFQKINFNEKNTIISEYRVALRIGRMCSGAVLPSRF